MKLIRSGINAYAPTPSSDGKSVNICTLYPCDVNLCGPCNRPPRYYYCL